MLDEKQFWNMTQQFLDEEARKWGFEPEVRGQFMRKHEGYWDGFEIGLSHGASAFVAEVGLHVPALFEKLKFINEWDRRTFPISHRLGTYRENGSFGANITFPFVNEWELNERLRERFVPRFEAWALPWFSRFRALTDVVAEFRRSRIGDLPANWPPGTPPKGLDPFGWAIYGWMLEQLGRKDEARGWWERAYAEVTRPLFIDRIGRFVSKEAKDSKPFQHSRAEERLEGLLRQSLESPLR